MYWIINGSLLMIGIIGIIVLKIKERNECRRVTQNREWLYRRILEDSRDHAMINFDSKLYGTILDIDVLEGRLFELDKPESTGGQLFKWNNVVEFKIKLNDPIRTEQITRGLMIGRLGIFPDPPSATYSVNFSEPSKGRTFIWGEEDGEWEVIEPSFLHKLFNQEIQ